MLGLFFPSKNIVICEILSASDIRNYNLTSCQQLGINPDKAKSFLKIFFNKIRILRKNLRQFAHILHVFQNILLKKKFKKRFSLLSFSLLCHYFIPLLPPTIVTICH